MLPHQDPWPVLGCNGLFVRSIVHPVPGLPHPA